MKIQALFWAWVLLNLLDWFLTCQIGLEMNPFLKPLLEYPVVFLFYKLLCSVLIAGVLLHYRRVTILVCCTVGMIIIVTLNGWYLVTISWKKVG